MEDDDDDFLSFLTETFALASSNHDVDTKARTIKADREQEFLDAFIVMAEREILPVFLSVKELHGHPITARIEGKGTGAVSLWLHRALSGGGVIVNSLAFSADRSKRMVRVNIHEQPVKSRGSDRDNEAVPLEKVTKTYVRGLVRHVFGRLNG